MYLGGQAAWDAHAAQLNARMAHMQVTVLPDWLFWLCTDCGASMESERWEQPEFRYAAATHNCTPVEEISRGAADLVADVLF